MTLTVIGDALTFGALTFDDWGGAHPMGKQALAFFPNGYGVSVICGPLSYGGPRGLFELGVLKGDARKSALTYETPITADVEGYLTPADVTSLMARVAALPTPDEA